MTYFDYNLAKTEKFDKDKHLNFYKKCLETRKMSLAPLDDIACNGIVGYYDDSPINLIFLRQSEGRHAVIDGLITDPSVLPDVRHAMNDMVIGEIINTAKELKLKSIMAWSEDLNTITRSLETHGARYIKGLIFVKDLE